METLPEIDTCGDGEIKRLVVVWVGWLPVKKLEELTASLPPITDTDLPQRVGIGVCGCVCV